MQLDWLADRYPTQLSAASASASRWRALAVEPKVLLLDEPFGALDAKVRKELRRWLRRLHDELHVTSIFVTTTRRRRWKSPTAWCRDEQGPVEQAGTPQQVWDQPASPSSTASPGDVNLFHGRAHEGLLHLDGVAIDTPEHAAARDAQAYAYVRPHDLEVERWQPGASGIVATLERAIVVARSRARAAAGGPVVPSGHDPLIEAQIPAERFRELGFKEGEKLVLSPKKARACSSKPGA